MNVKEPFGIVTGCYAGDRATVGATLASIRKYCPDTPVCLVVDGHIDVSDLEELYDLIILRVEELEHEDMRDLIRGSGRAKLAAMWEGPFEHYVWLDADAIVWGDVTEQIRRDVDFQIFWDEISIPRDAEDEPHWLAHFYFDMEELKKFDPNFEWRGHPYFSTGAFACRRNVISYQEWIKIEAWNNSVPGGVFRFWEQGMLNYFVLAKSQRGEIKTVMTDLQYIWRHQGTHELQADCVGIGWTLPDKIKRPKIAHFCGRKPNVFDFKSYSRPFTIARLAHHRQSRGNLGAVMIVFREDGRAIMDKVIRKIKRIIGCG
jgi:hypothetical protein